MKKKLDQTMVTPLLRWYDKNRRILPWREEPAPYRVWVSEIMLQQTRVEAVKPYFERFMKELPDIPALSEVEDDKLMKLWEGLGYYNRARNLKVAANQIMEQHGGQMPADYERILNLKGIGEYTAGAIGSIAFGLCVPAVDGNVLRVITRLTGDESDILKAATKKKITNALMEVLPQNRPGDFNQALMELGATVCVPNGAPRCDICPWERICVACREDLTYKIPVKTPKKPRRIEEKTVFLIEYQGKIALRKRPAQGLLAGLWEFPNAETMFSGEEMRGKLLDWKVEGFTIEETKKAKHIFTHVEWHMKGYYIHCEQKPAMDDLIWISREDMSRSYAIPTAFAAFKGVL